VNQQYISLKRKNAQNDDKYRLMTTQQLIDAILFHSRSRMILNFPCPVLYLQLTGNYLLLIQCTA